MRPDQLLFPGARERFRREVETVARLQHPGIVPVHAVGEENGIPYFAMELVRGASLDAVLASVAGRDPTRLSGADLTDPALADEEGRTRMGGCALPIKGAFARTSSRPR